MVRLAAADPEYDEECERLEREVIERAKVRRKAEGEFDKDRAPRAAQDLLTAEIAEDAAIDALIEFESQHLLKG